MPKRTLQFGFVLLLYAIVFGGNAANWMTRAVSTRAEAAANARQSAPPSLGKPSAGLDANGALAVLIWAQIGDGVWAKTDSGMEITAVHVRRDPKTQNKIFAVRTRPAGTESWTNGASYDRAGAAIKAMQSAWSIQFFKTFVNGRVVD